MRTTRSLILVGVMLAAAGLPAAAAPAKAPLQARSVGPSAVEGTVVEVAPGGTLRLDTGVRVDLSRLENADRTPPDQWAGRRILAVGRALVGPSGVVLLAASAPRVLEPAPHRGVRRVWAEARSSSDITVQGTVASIFEDGFMLQVSMMSVYQVLVTQDTEFEGVDGLSGLSVGDLVEARGTRDMWNEIVADHVRLLSSGGGDSGDQEVTLEGMVGFIGGDSFTLQAMAGSYEVLVGPDTEWVDVAGLEALNPGDRVEVHGVAGGWTVEADRVRLLASGGGGDGDGGGGDGGDGGGPGGGGSGGSTSDSEGSVESVGEITSVMPGGQFWMDDGRRYGTDQDTVYSPEIGSAAGLAVGLYVRVTASYRCDHGLVAEEVVYLGEQQQGQDYVTFQGTVLTAAPDELTLSGGWTIRLTGATQFEGDADEAGDIRQGWLAHGRAVSTADGGLEAVTLWAWDPAPPSLEGQSYVAHEALVIPVEGADVAAIAARHGASLVGTVGSLGALLWWDQELTDALLGEVEADPEVAAVEPNYRFRDPESSRKRYPIVDRSPSSSEFNQQPALELAGVPPAGEGPTGNGIVVAVLDTGVDPFHPALRHALLEGGLDLVDGDMEPWESRDGVDEDGDGDVDEAAGHGTFVASVVRLVAPGARILPYRVLDDDGGGTAYAVAVALADAIERRADVINISLTYQERSQAVDRLLQRAAEAGIVVVASAGNEGSPTLPFPAEDGHVIAVGALNALGDALADFSNGAGDGILAAPGTEVYGALDQGEFGTSTGTSMAAPFVAGASALLLELGPRLDPEVVGAILRETATPLGGDPGSGLGLDVGAAVAAVSP